MNNILFSLKLRIKTWRTWNEAIEEAAASRKDIKISVISAVKTCTFYVQSFLLVTWIWNISITENVGNFRFCFVFGMKPEWFLGSENWAVTKLFTSFFVSCVSQINPYSATRLGHPLTLNELLFSEMVQWSIE